MITRVTKSQVLLSEGALLINDGLPCQEQRTFQYRYSIRSGWEDRSMFSLKMSDRVPENTLAK